MPNASEDTSATRSLDGIPHRYDRSVNHATIKRDRRQIVYTLRLQRRDGNTMEFLAPAEEVIALRINQD